MKQAVAARGAVAGLLFLYISALAPFLILRRASEELTRTSKTLAFLTRDTSVAVPAIWRRCASSLLGVVLCVVYNVIQWPNTLRYNSWFIRAVTTQHVQILWLDTDVIVAPLNRTRLWAFTLNDP